MYQTHKQIQKERENLLVYFAHLNKCEEELSRQEAQNKSKSKTRKSIPKPLKSKVWKRDHGNVMEAPCWVCTKIITYDEFDCGHILAISKGEDNVRQFKSCLWDL